MNEYLKIHWLNIASSIRVGDCWYNVLGYDDEDDVICLENQTGNDITISSASESISLSDIKVEVNVAEALDILFDMS
jgi:hypothetical protein